jgi:hypothetical protein
LSSIFEIVDFVHVLLLEELFRFLNFEGCAALDVSELGMASEEILYAAGCKSEDGKGTSFIEVDLFYWRWNG